MRPLDIKIKIWEPGARANVGLEIERVFLEHGDEYYRVECRFGVIEAAGHVFDHGDDGFVGELIGVGVVDHAVVRAFEELGPGGADVGFVAVGGRLVDHEADVEVGGLVGESVE